jgi:CarboxypepD_reg-like domain/Carboxypeptidase regulatory-like domain
LSALGRLAAQTISGRVYDSLSSAPLVGATVQLVASPRGVRAPIQAITDSRGNYRLNEVPAGAYILGFYHPLLDSIGIEPPLVRITIDGTSGPAPVHVDLGVPSAASVITAVCGTAAAKNGSFGVAVGRVYDATSREPVGGASVVAEWQRIAVASTGLDVSTPRLIATTTSAGGFAFCGVPRDDDIILTAIRGQDSTGRVTLHVSAAGFAHRLLYVDKANLVTLVATDSLGASQPMPKVVRRGHGRLAGTVVDAQSHRPLAGAQVAIVGADLSERTNDRGAFSISGAPGGTQAVLVRAVGYVPEHRAVELLSDSSSQLDVGLTTVRTMLDTMRITAAYSNAALGFDQRRRSGLGRFLDSTDVERRRPFETTRLLEDVPGIRLAGSGASLRIFDGHVQPLRARHLRRRRQFPGLERRRLERDGRTRGNRRGGGVYVRGLGAGPVQEHVGVAHALRVHRCMDQTRTMTLGVYGNSISQNCM